MPKIYPRCKGVSIAQSEGVGPKGFNWFSYVRIMSLNSKQVGSSGERYFTFGYLPALSFW